MLPLIFFESGDPLLALVGHHALDLRWLDAEHEDEVDL